MQGNGELQAKSKGDVRATKKRGILKKRILSKWQLYVLMLPAIVYTLIFAYKPMYGILIAFERYSVRKGIFGSQWVGLENFRRLFSSFWFPIIFRNTLVLSVLGLVIGFPLPIILALLLNELRNQKYRTFVQTVSYLPHFISTVVMCGIITQFLNPNNGIINEFIARLGGEKLYFMQNASWFKWIYVLSGTWQGVGWSSIIYFAALSGVDKALLEAAEIDGASRLDRIRYINVPEIMPTMAIMFVLACGGILSVGYEKAYLLQNSLNLEGSEIISTYVYKVGLQQSDFSFSTATGLFNTVINCILLLAANTLSRRITDSGLF